ncbi:hypothetical protein, partial [Lacticaseibacillus paracasei]|uniref:hypothetical protein n=1 Tax=Lacticaseibacillus paracasei TaxID=1597 RepID=UPI001E2C9D58
HSFLQTPTQLFHFYSSKVAIVDRPPNDRNKRAAHPAVLFAAPDHKQREKFSIKNGLLTERVRKPFWLIND